MRQLARKKFGFDSLHAAQEAAIAMVVCGRDTLAIMPTGGGKSAIYQIAGLLLGDLALVVSPLVALQRDQVEAMRARGIAAHWLNSSLAPAEREAIWEELSRGGAQFLLLAPEQFANSQTLERLCELKPALFVVDEAHCVSSWGHDFRPDYSRLKVAVEELGRPPILALTATAAPPVREEICAALGMRDPNILVAGFDRPNIYLEVRHFQNAADKRAALVEGVCGGERPAIVYAATRREVEELAESLCEAGMRAQAYHAGLGGDERSARQSAFMNGETEVMTATIAFGMGIDKSDVRHVWHFDVAESLDAYDQEIGRAGRDGQPARATLFFCHTDLGIRKFQASGTSGATQTVGVAAVVVDLAAQNPEGFVDEAVLRAQVDLGAPSLQRALAQLEQSGALEVRPGGELVPRDKLSLKRVKSDVEQLNQQSLDWDKSRVEMMRRYAEMSGCRRQFLLAYFGENLENPCGHCDNCVRAEVNVDEGHQPFAPGTRVAHRSWGQGEVLRYEGDSMTVVFDEVGYKTLLVELVARDGLLRAVV